MTARTTGDLTAASLLADTGRCRRVVIKIGSALLVDAASGRLDRGWLAALAGDVARLRARGQEVLIVSSGAVALGRGGLGLTSPSARLEEAQAAAAIGQIRLAHAYEALLAEHTITVAQLLLTIADLENRARYLNARNTVETLMDHGVLPIINENDTVATSEIRFGDNDRLAARVAQLASADLLLLLSDIDGLYSADPRREPAARFIDRVDDITADVAAMAGPPASGGPGSGGMITKLQAARIATAAGCSLAIIDGRQPGPVDRYEKTGRGTLFPARDRAPAVRKQWIGSLMTARGTLRLDAGAVAALKRGASLLPAGITAVDGDFDRGDLVTLAGPRGQAVGQGLAGYKADEARRIAGHKSHEIEAILGYSGRGAIIHRDDLVLF